MRKSAIVSNLQDGLSCIFVVLTHVLESYTGQFNVILLCTASYVMGLSLLWSSKRFGTISQAVALIAFGRASTIKNFVRHQLEEKVRKRGKNSAEASSDNKNRERGETSSEHQKGEDSQENKEISTNSGNGNRDEITEISSENLNRDDSRESRGTNYEHFDKEDYKDGREISSKHENEQQIKEAKGAVNLSTVLWIGSASICGIIANGIFIKYQKQWKKSFKLATLLLGAAHFLFYSGSFCYSFERPRRSPLFKIYRVFVAAVRKRKLKYPDCEGGYISKNHEQDFSFRKNGTIRLKPEFPSLWVWLDKAAIKTGEVEKQSCSVKEVREVKIFSSLMHMSFTFWPFSLVLASANTFFVEQAGALNPDFNVNYLFVVSAFANSLANSSFNFLREKRPKKGSSAFKLFLKKLERHKNRINIVRIGVGMGCAVVCCLVAGLLELHRLSLTKKGVSMSIAVLIPQFWLLGLTEGLVERGLQIFYSNYLPETMVGLVFPVAKFVSGAGKLLTVPCILILRSWIKESINDSHLDRYFLMLAVLNIVALGWFLSCAWRYGSYKEKNRNDEELGNEE
ncbi:hypothetical protein L6164_002224 [Bauhinia variegata]|uniref:Uncharacterized protein n=1 Tax=Bauhinia variegata TaxID=167791 RepID=A0ACB9PXK6_BAUVA|nr:hypothetical protein L6164_002224 [Bauhinia variegata]